MFGSDTIDTKEVREAERREGKIPTGIGEGTHLDRCIVDSNARIGANCKLLNKHGVVDGRDNTGLPQGIIIKDGIICVMRGAVIPPGTVV